MQTAILVDAVYLLSHLQPIATFKMASDPVRGQLENIELEYKQSETPTISTRRNKNKRLKSVVQRRVHEKNMGAMHLKNGQRKY